MKGLCFNSKQIYNDHITKYRGSENINYGCSMRGAWRALQCMGNDIAIVIHGPIGCNNEFKLDYSDGLARTYCTDMKETDVITGGIKKLEDLLLKLECNVEISLIVILTTCTSELIGENIEGLISQLKGNLHKKYIVLHTSGISGMVQSEGHNLVISNLIKNFTVETENDEKSVNYIGYSWPLDNESGRDISELNNILKEIGIKLNAVMTSGMSYTNIFQASKASLNIVRCPGSAYGLINYMKNQFNIPYIKLPIPIGIKNTHEFLFSLIDYFDLPNEKKEIINNYEQFTIRRLEKLKKFLCGKKVAVAVGANRTLYLVEALIELGLDIKVISFYRLHETIGDDVVNISGNTFNNLSKLTEEYNLNCDVLIYADSKQFFDIVKNADIDIVFDVHTNRKLINKMGIAFSESMDVTHPYHFYFGFLALAYDLVKEINQPFFKKYKEYII